MIYKNKWGNNFEDALIISPSELANVGKDANIIITTMYENEVSKQLEIIDLKISLN